MGAKRIVLGTVLVFIVILAAALVFSYFYLSPPRPNPVLLGDRPVRTSDLPAELRGKTDTELQARLDELLGQGSEGMKFWWGTRLAREESKEARLLALYLGDDRNAVRSLIWLAGTLHREDNTGEALQCLEVATYEAESAGLKEEQAQAHLNRARCLESLGLCYWAVNDYDTAIALYGGLDLPDRLFYAQSMLGSLYCRSLNDYGSGLDCFRRALELEGRLEPERLAPVEMLYALFMSDVGQVREAIPVFESAGVHAREAGKAGSALMALDYADQMRLLINNPAFTCLPLVRNDYGTGQAESGTWQLDRTTTLTESVKLLEDQHQAVDFLQEVLARLAAYEAGLTGDPEEKQKYVNSINRERSEFLTALGQAYLRLNDFQSALVSFQQADALIDYSSVFVMPRQRMQMNLAKAYAGLEQHDAALAQLEASWNSLSEPERERVKWNNPEFMLLMGKVNLEVGDLDQAEKWLDLAEGAIWDIMTPDMLRTNSKLKSYRGDLAAARGDFAAEYQHRTAAFGYLVSAGSLFSWDSGYRHGLLGEIQAAADQLIPLCQAGGDDERAEEVALQVELAQRACDLEFTPVPAEPDERMQLLVDYRTAITELCYLHYMLYSLTTSDEPDWDYIIQRHNLRTRYRNELIRQHKRSLQDLEERILELEKETDILSNQIYQTNSDLIDVVFLSPRYDGVIF